MNRAAFVGGWPFADFTLPTPLPEIVLLGRSNVGKSSLLNALTGRKSLARTSGAPGKTRECNAYLIDDAYYLLDLPGYGYAKVGKSQRKAFRRLIAQTLDRARVVAAVWLLDIRRDPSPDDLELAEMLRHQGTPILAALTKADKVGRTRRLAHVQAIARALELPEDQCVVTSATSREGIVELGAAIAAVAA